MFCKNCGGENPDYAKFCKFCGSSLMPDFSEVNNNSGYSENTCNAPTPERNYLDADNRNNAAQPVQSESKSVKSNPLSIVGMILGVLSLLSLVLCAEAPYMLFFIGFPFAIVGLVLSFKSKNYGSNIFNILGIIFSIIGIPVNVILGIIGHGLF